MVKLIHRDTGGDMWVHETRVNEYLAKGHKLAPPPSPPPKKTRTKKEV